MSHNIVFDIGICSLKFVWHRACIFVKYCLLFADLRRSDLQLYGLSAEIMRSMNNSTWSSTVLGKRQDALVACSMNKLSRQDWRYTSYQYVNDSF